MGAVDQEKMVAQFSSRGKVDVAAPGVKILSCWPARELMKLSGTSMATPFVAGVAALVLAARGVKSPSQMLKALRESAIDLGAPGPDGAYGFGLIDPAKLLAAGAVPTPPPAWDGKLSLNAGDFSASGLEKLKAAGLSELTIKV